MFIIFTPSLVRHDAVSTDVYQSFLTLKENGLAAVLFAESFDPFFKPWMISKKEVKELILDPHNILILHHSTDSHCCEELFDEARCRILIKYHNITPYQFYMANQSVEGSTLRARLLQGRLQNQKYAESKKPFQLIADSHYNGLDFSALSEVNKPFTVIPPFHLVHEMAKVKDHEEVASELTAFSGVKLLYVSRICANKGQLHLADIVHQYIQHYGTNIKLFLIGKVTDRSYGSLLVDRINQLGLGSFISMRENVSFPELVTYYRKSSLFLLPSEHEGFGVPIIEAQFLKLPIIAYASSAIPETSGEGALLLDSLDPKLWAAAINYCSNHVDFMNFLRKKGLENYEKFSYETIKNHFLSTVLTS